MLAAQGIVSAADAHALREALDGVSQDEIRDVKYDGTYEDLFFYVERLIIAGVRRGRRRPAAHGALPQRHRHDDVPDAAARVHPRAAGRAPSSCAARCSTSSIAHRDTIFAVHTHTQRAQPTTVAHYLLAVVEQLERDAVAAEGGVRPHQPQPARRLRDHRHRVSRSIAS